MVIALAIGPNSVEIAVNLFPNMEEAIKYYKDNGFPVNGNKVDIDVINDRNADRESDEYNNILKKIFKDGDYYGGCGEADVLHLREIKFFEPFAGFNLD